MAKEHGNSRGRAIWVGVAEDEQLQRIRAALAARSAGVMPTQLAVIRAAFGLLEKTITPAQEGNP